MEFSAAWAEANHASDSRTVLADNGQDILWTAGETIKVFYGSRFSGKFTSSNTEPQSLTTFKGTLTMVTGSIEQGNESSRYWAVYPYDSTNTCDDQSVTMTVPHKQKGRAGTFADKFFPAVAVSATPDLAFYNVCGGACFSVTREGIYKAVFKSNDGSPMAGKVKIGFGEDNKPQILEVATPVDSVVVMAPVGGFVPGENYFAAMLPHSHTEGITLTLMTTRQKAVKSVSSVKAVHRSAFGRLTNIDAGLDFEDIIDDTYAVPAIVDMGLSVMWASFNLGATKPEETGYYFAWGEILPKVEYTPENYLWAEGGDDTYTIIKYTDNNKIILEPEDDAATVNLGGSWRMPTKNELDELVNNCTWNWITLNGVSGYLVTGPNSNSIFLPTAGSWGRYWSSSLFTESVDFAWYFEFDSSDVVTFFGDRYCGFPIRPVQNDSRVTEVSLNKTNLQVMIGDTEALTATVVPSTAIDKSVAWTTSNETVATVNSEGVVAGVSAGTAVISVTTVDGGFTAECTVTVKEKYKAQTPELVDLGLPSGLKWATFNLGATKPEEYGDYFAWGETEPKEDYSLSTYKWCKGGERTITKYCSRSDYGYNGFTDNKTVLEPEDDAAAVALGGSWRMPTKAEQDELRTKCTWTWTTQNGVNGYLVTGPNGNSIFLPAASYWDGTSLDGAGSRGNYWSSSLNTDGPRYVYLLYFNSSGVSTRSIIRFYGRSVRPVTE